MEKREILNEIVNLDASKSCQDTNVLKIIINEYADIFAGLNHSAINTAVNKNKFPPFLKLADVIPVFKKVKTTQNTITGIFFKILMWL